MITVYYFSYSIGLIYDQLMTLIKQKYSKEDDDFVQKISELKKCNLNPTTFGAQKAFEHFSIPRYLINQFMDLDKETTPLSKLNCMRKTLDTINDRLKKTVDEQKSPFDNRNKIVYIMSDDLIATVICVLAHCEPKAFCSNIKFIHSFSWYLPQNSELGYSLVTFEVAKEYIQNHFVDSQESSLKKDQQAKYSANKAANLKYNSQFSYFDHEIDKITKMLGDSEIKCESENTQDRGELG